MYASSFFLLFVFISTVSSLFGAFILFLFFFIFFFFSYFSFLFLLHFVSGRDFYHLCINIPVFISDEWMDNEIKVWVATTNTNCTHWCIIARYYNRRNEEAKQSEMRSEWKKEKEHDLQFKISRSDEDDDRRSSACVVCSERCEMQAAFINIHVRTLLSAFNADWTLNFQSSIFLFRFFFLIFLLWYNV